LASETLSVLGGDNITSKMSANNKITIDLDAELSGLTSLAGTANNMLLHAGTESDYDDSSETNGTLLLQGDTKIKSLDNHDFAGNIDVDGTANLDVVAVDGTVTVGADDTGYDVTFHGATAGKKMLWDESEDTLVVDGSTDLNGALDVSGAVGLADTDVATTIRGTLGVTQAATFTAQSVHSAGLQTGGSIVSDTDSTDSLGSSTIRFAATHTDKVEMTNSESQDFSADMDGTAVTIATLGSDYDSAKVVLKVKDGANITTKEVLFNSGSFVEYGTLTVGTEIAMTIAVNSGALSVNASDGTAKGTISYIKA
jgi:hypothetical protein